MKLIDLKKEELTLINGGTNLDEACYEEGRSWGKATRDAIYTVLTIIFFL